MHKRSELICEVGPAEVQLIHHKIYCKIFHCKNNQRKQMASSSITTNEQQQQTALLKIPHFPEAGQPDIIRSQQKDKYYILVMNAYVKEVGQWLIGTRNMMKYEKEIETATRCLYYSIQTLTNQPTLGEEYCDIVQVKFDANKVILSPYSNRIVMTFLNTLFPYLWDKFTPSVNKWLTSKRWKLWSSNEESASLVNVDLEQLIQFVLRFHLAVFYIAGTYLQVSKRITGIRYVFTGTSEMQRPTYRVLGVLIFVQQFVSFVQYFSQLVEVRRKRRKMLLQTSDDLKESQPTKQLIEHEIEVTEETEENDDGAFRCALCLDRRKHTTATSCGHLFCWRCITECIANYTPSASASNANPKCPICRQDVAMQTLTRVYHYDTPLDTTLSE
jgi:peroxin-10